MFPAKKIVCPTDFSEGSIRALAEATELALHFGAEIYLVHVIEFLPAMTEPAVLVSPTELRPQAEESLRKIAEPLIARGVRVQTAIGEGEVAREIVHLAQELGADLIVIATHGNTGWRHLAFGSVTESVVRRATCPVLTVRMMAASAANAVHAA